MKRMAEKGDAVWMTGGRGADIGGLRREIVRERQRQRETERETERETDRQRETETERDRESGVERGGRGRLKGRGVKEVEWPRQVERVMYM